MIRSLAAVASTLVACGGPHASGAGSPDADWTLLVYMAADDNLERAGIINLQEMAEVGSGAQVNVVVQIDRGPPMLSASGFVRAPLLNLPDFNGGKRLRVDRDRVTELADLGETDTGDPATLADFVAWGVKTFPARKTALLLWDHGAATAGFGWDVTNDQDSLSIGELRQAIADGLARAGRSELDLIGFDACVMSTVEIAGELRDLTDVYVASEALEPLHGWAYQPLIRALAGGASAIDAGKAVVAGYQELCRAKQTVSGCAMTVIDETRVDAVVRAVDALGADLAAKVATDWPAVARAPADAEEYSNPPGTREAYRAVDVTDLARRAPVDPARAQAVADAVAAATIANFHGASIPAASGLSVVFPAPPFRAPVGADLAMMKLPGWRGFLDAYLARRGADPTPPVISAPTVTAISRGFEVSARVGGDDVHQIYGVVGQPGPGDTTTVLQATTLAAGASFRWDRLLDTVTDGTRRSPVTLFDEGSFTDDLGRRVRLVSTDADIIPADDDRYEVTIYLELPDGGAPRIRGAYQYGPHGEVSEADPDDSDQLEPLLYGLDDDDDEVWIPSGVRLSLADEDAIVFARTPAPAGDYQVGLAAIDYDDNVSASVTTVTVP